MADNDIIKAFECCSNAEAITDCGICPYYKKGCLDKVHADAIDLINRQKAEIEELRKGFAADMDYFASEYDSKIKAEAINEFAERLKEKVSPHNCRWLGNPYDIEAVEVKDIDSLVKEMVGE